MNVILHPKCTVILNGVKNPKFSQEINIPSGKAFRFFATLRMTLHLVRVHYIGDG